MAWLCYHLAASHDTVGLPDNAIKNPNIFRREMLLTRKVVPRKFYGRIFAHPVTESNSTNIAKEMICYNPLASQKKYLIGSQYRMFNYSPISINISEIDNEVNIFGSGELCDFTMQND